MVESVLGKSLFTLREPCLTEPWGKEGHFAWANTGMYLVHIHTQTCACSYAHTSRDQFQQLFTVQSMVTKPQWQTGSRVVCCYGCNGLPRRVGQVFQNNHWCRVVRGQLFHCEPDFLKWCASENEALQSYLKPQLSKTLSHFSISYYLSS